MATEILRDSNLPPGKYRAERTFLKESQHER